MVARLAWGAVPYLALVLEWVAAALCLVSIALVVIVDRTWAAPAVIALAGGLLARRLGRSAC